MVRGGGGDIQQKFTHQRLLKNFENFEKFISKLKQKFKIQNFSKLKFNGILEIFLKFKKIKKIFII